MTNLAELVRYSAWASRKFLQFANTLPEEELNRAAPNSHGGIPPTFQHIYYADRIWLTRLERGPKIPFEDLAPGPTLQDLDALWQPLLDRLTAIAETHDPAEQCGISRSPAESYSLAIWQIVQHVVNHATYHRGQIAAMLRQTGHTLPSTDYLRFVLGL